MMLIFFQYFSGEKYDYKKFYGRDIKEFYFPDHRYIFILCTKININESANLDSKALRTCPHYWQSSSACMSILLRIQKTSSLFIVCMFSFVHHVSQNRAQPHTPHRNNIK